MSCNHNTSRIIKILVFIMNTMILIIWCRWHGIDELDIYEVMLHFNYDAEPNSDSGNWHEHWVKNSSPWFVSVGALCWSRRVAKAGDSSKEEKKMLTSLAMRRQVGRLMKTGISVYPPAVCSWIRCLYQHTYQKLRSFRSICGLLDEFL